MGISRAHTTLPPSMSAPNVVIGLVANNHKMFAGLVFELLHHPFPVNAPVNSRQTIGLNREQANANDGEQDDQTRQEDSNRAASKISTSASGESTEPTI